MLLINGLTLRKFLIKKKKDLEKEITFTTKKMKKKKKEKTGWRKISTKLKDQNILILRASAFGGQAQFNC